MGEPVSATIAALAFGSKVFSASQTIIGGAIQRENLRTRKTQERIAATNRSIQRTEDLSRILSSNTARAAARGIGLSSPSFRSIQANDFNVFNEDEKADSLNTRFRENFLNQKIRASSRAEVGSLINLVGKTALQAAKFKFGESIAKASTSKSGRL